jgi:hypothetical protein
MAFGVISIKFSLSEDKLWLYNKLHFGDGDDEDGGSDGGGSSDGGDDNNGGGDGRGGNGELFVELLVDREVEMKLLERDGTSGDSGGGDGGGDGEPFAELSVGGELEMKLMERGGLSGDIERDLDRVDVDEDEDLEDLDREDSDEDRLLLHVRNFLSHSLYFGNGCQGPAKSPNALWVTNL